MSLVLDAGALIKQELLAGRTALTHGGVVGQVWRGGAGRQVHLARLLPALDIAGLDDSLGRQAGILLGRARKSDIIDAALVLIAEDGDFLLTSDPSELESLAAAADLHIEIVPV